MNSGLAKHLQNALLRHAHYMLNVRHLPQLLQLYVIVGTISTSPLPQHHPQTCLYIHTFNLTTLIWSPLWKDHVMY